MSAILTKLGVDTRGLTETVQPFVSWADSSVTDWEVVLRMLTVGDLIKLSERASNASSTVGLTYLSKVHLLAMAVQSIQGQPIATTEDVNDYNEKHGLTGNSQISLYDYKVLLIKELSELVINYLVSAYDALQDRYMKRHLGVLPTEQKFDIDKFNLGKATHATEAEDSDNDKRCEERSN